MIILWDSIYYTNTVNCIHTVQVSGGIHNLYINNTVYETDTVGKYCDNNQNYYLEKTVFEFLGGGVEVCVYTGEIMLNFEI